MKVTVAAHNCLVDVDLSADEVAAFCTEPLAFEAGVASRTRRERATQRSRSAWAYFIWGPDGTCLAMAEGIR